MPNVAYAPLQVGDGPGFEALLALYNAALPATERKAPAVLARMLGRADYTFELARRDGAPVGFSVAYHGAGLALLEYIAVAAQARGGGIGAGLYRRVLGSANRLPLIIEVDSEREPSSDRAIRVRRKSFYRRLGCRQVESLAYDLPLDGSGAPPAMDLLVDNLPVETVPRTTVAAWLREIYVEIYGCRPDDPRLGSMISGLPSSVRLT